MEFHNEPRGMRNTQADFQGLIVGWAILALAGCSEGSVPEAVQVTEADSAGVTIVTIVGEVDSLPLWSLATDPDFEISGNAEPFLAGVGEVEFLSDGSLLVEDQQARSLFLFDPSGRLVRRVGDRGEGPGQFENINQLSVTPGDTVYAYDRRLQRVSVFTRSGDLIRTIPIAREEGGFGATALNTWALNSEHLYLHRASPYDTASPKPRPRRDQRDVILSRFGSDGEPRPESTQFAGGFSVDFDGGNGRAPFSNEPVVEAKAGRVFYGSGLDYEVVVADSALRPRRVIRWPDFREPLTESDVESARDSVLARFGPLATQRPEIVARVLEATFAPALIPEFKPALGPLFVDETGRLWLSRFVPFTEPWNQLDVWHVLSPEGHPAGRLALPSRTKIAAVRADRVALVRVDEFDVQHVLVLRFTERSRLNE